LCFIGLNSSVPASEIFVQAMLDARKILSIHLLCQPTLSHANLTGLSPPGNLPEQLGTRFPHTHPVFNQSFP